MAIAARHTWTPFSAGSSAGGVPLNEPEGEARSTIIADNDESISQQQQQQLLCAQFIKTKPKRKLGMARDLNITAFHDVLLIHNV